MANEANNESQSARDAAPPLTEAELIILPVRQAVLFPGIILPLAIGRPASIAAAQEAARSQRMLGVVLQNDPSVDDPTPNQLHRMGTVAQILRYVTSPEGVHHVICRGARRFRITEFVPGHAFLVARVEEIGSAEVLTPEIEARTRLLRERAREAVQLLPNAPGEILAAIESIDSASGLADFVAGVMDASVDEKQEVLEAIDVKERLDKVLSLLARRLEVLRLSK
ncbi:MAG: LON peptidase substrate-binding domain-containing protein, partial [Hyphomicrobiales bacterium]|nr:LON peptidase substrate-binding domain-containing protein [Hyphomicrobiales bacterium]MBV9751836.1 LON peptidase substrate-binding domain-containing protein [Hyphomicrobiales bacterium]